MKKLLLITVFLSSALFATAQNIIDQGTCGTSLTWVLTDDGKLTIDGSGSMTNYSTTSNPPWNSYLLQITSVQIGSSVTSVGNYAFYGCTNILELTIPGSVTAIGISAFQGCSSLHKLTISDGSSSLSIYVNTSTYTNGSFLNCPIDTVYCGRNITPSSSGGSFTSTSALFGAAVNSLTFGNSVTNVARYAFYGCTPLMTLSFPNAFTAINDYAFYGCTGIPELTIPGSVTAIGACAFQGCNSLHKLTFSDASSSLSMYVNKSTTTYGSFYNCPIDTIYFGRNITHSSSTGSYTSVSTLFGTAVKSLTFGNSVTNVATCAFYGCTQLMPLSFPNAFTTINDYAFYGCTGIPELTIPGSVTAIGACAFQGCSSINKLTISDGSSNLSIYVNTMSGSTPYYYGSFYNCPIDTVYYGRNITPTYSTGSLTSISALFGTDVKGLTFGNSVTNVAQYAFYGCTQLTPLSLPSAVTTISNYAFYGCSSIPELTITGSVTAIGACAFQGCSSIHKLTISDGSSSLSIYVNTMSGTTPNYYGSFYNCPIDTIYYGRNITPTYSIGSLTSISALFGTAVNSLTFGNSVTNVARYAFYGCTLLTPLSLPNAITTINYYAFYGCSSIPELIIPGSVTTIGQSAFQGCSSLHKLSISSASSNLSIYVNTMSGSTPYYYGSFYNCPIDTVYYGRNITPTYSTGSLTSISALFGTAVKGLTFGNSVINVAPYAFYDCTQLTPLSLPNAVTTIDYCAFYGCSSIPELIIPGAVTSIGSSAFQNCSSLHKLTISDGSSSLNIYVNTSTYTDGSFRNCPIDTVYYGRNIAPSISGGSYTSTSAMFGTAVKSLTFGNSVTNVARYAFYGCTQLTPLSLPNAITTINYYAFYGCTGIPELILPSAVTTIYDYAFYGCSSIPELIIPGSVTTIGQSAFQGCSSLHKLTISDGSSSLSIYVNTMSGTTPYYYGSFYNCPIDTVYYGRNITPTYSTGSLTSISVLFGTVVKGLTFGNSVTNVATCAFYGCTQLTPLSLPSAVTTINNSAFYGCSSIPELIIPGAVTSIGSSAFQGCSSLHKLTISDGSSSLSIYVNTMSGTTPNYYGSFYNCPIDTVYYGRNITPNLSSGNLNTTSYLFGTAVKGLTFGNSVTNVATCAFYGCTQLTPLSLPSAVTTINNSAFYGCSSIPELIVPSSVTTIGLKAFQSCTSLHNLTVLDAGTDLSICVNYTYNSVQYNYGSFYNCPIDTVYYGRNITPNLSSGYLNTTSYLFGTAVKGLTFGNSVTNVATCAFYGCTGMEKIYSDASNPPAIATNAFTNVPAATPVFVTCGYLYLYQNSTDWTNLFSNISVENPIFDVILVVESNDNQFGFVEITTQPNCTDNQAVFSATPNTGYCFYQWNDGNTTNPRTVNVNSNITYTAVFEHIPLITVLANDVSYGTVAVAQFPTCSNNFQGIISATPHTGYYFTQWNDGNTSNPRTVTVNADISYTAIFSALPGTAGNPYLITTAAELAQLATWVNNGTAPYANAGVYYKLANNIDLSGYQTGVGWTPIGTPTNQFKGNFDGNGKIITGLKIYANNLNYNTNIKYVGLFGCSNGSINNVCISYMDIYLRDEGGVFAGGIVGYNYSNGTVSNCNSAGLIQCLCVNGTAGSGQSCVGGIAGVSEDAISNSHSSATVIGTSGYYNMYSSECPSYAGGIVGYMWQNATVSNCYYSAHVMSESSSFSTCAGGIVGWIGQNTTVTNCYSQGQVNSTNSPSSTTIYARAGGVAGIVDHGTVSNCYSTSTISSNSTYIALSGGIAGQCVGTISNCVALNPGLTCSSTYFGRVTGYNAGTLLNNFGFSQMVNPSGDTIWNNIGATNLDGASLNKVQINTDGTLGNHFTTANGWTTQNGELPGLFGNTVDMPLHLQMVAPVITMVSLPNGETGIAYSQTLTATGETPMTWSLETGSLPNGLSLSTSGIISGTPTTAGTYNFTVKATNGAGNDTKQLSILIVSGVSGHIIAGKTRYLKKAIAGNPAPNQPVYNAVTYNIDNVEVILNTSPGGAVVATTMSDANGNYQFTNVPDGDYILAYDHIPYPDTMQYVNHVNAIDLALLKYNIGHNPVSDPSRYFSDKHRRGADVDNNASVNSVDMARISAKIGMPSDPARNFPKGNWVAFDTLVTVAGTDLNVTLQTVAFGDYDASSGKYQGAVTNWSMAKVLPDEDIIIRSDESIMISDPDYFEVPLRISTKMNELSAVGLELNYPNDKYKLVSASMSNTGKDNGPAKINPTLEEIIAANNDLLVTDDQGIIRVVFATTDHFDVAANDELVRLGFRPLTNAGQGELDFYLKGTGLIANQYGEINEDAFLTMPKIFVQGEEPQAGYEFSGYPNPFNDDATLTYFIPENGKVKLNVYNSLGELITELVNETQTIGNHTVVFSQKNLSSGMYTFKLEFAGWDKSKCMVIRMVH